ncbi:MAG: hypothetical protein ACR2HR_07725, partial [Euzebya sp.]
MTALDVSTATEEPAAAGSGPVLTDEHVVFRLADPERRYLSVGLYQELSRPRDGQATEWVEGHWTVSLPRPDLVPDGALRMEYAFIVQHADGGQEFITDPGNPLVAEGAFGAKSVVEFPGYRRPAWLDQPPHDQGTISWADLPLPRFADALPCGIWQPAGTDPTQPLPLLIVHDGPEFASLARLTDLLSQALVARRIPPLRAALLGPVPGRRDETYSAAARYADGLAFTALPWLARTAPQPPDAPPV